MTQSHHSPATVEGLMQLILRYAPYVLPEKQSAVEAYAERLATPTRTVGQKEAMEALDSLNQFACHDLEVASLGEYEVVRNYILQSTPIADDGWPERAAVALQGAASIKSNVTDMLQLAQRGRNVPLELMRIHQQIDTLALVAADAQRVAESTPTAAPAVPPLTGEQKNAIAMVMLGVSQRALPLTLEQVNDLMNQVYTESRHFRAIEAATTTGAAAARIERLANSIRINAEGALQSDPGMSHHARTSLTMIAEDALRLLGAPDNFNNPTEAPK